MIVGNSISINGGYTRRIALELDILAPALGRPVLFYPEGSIPAIDPNKFDKMLPYKSKFPTFFTTISFSIEMRKRYALNPKPSFIYAESLFPAYYSILYSFLHKIPLILDYHGVAPEEALMQSRGLKKYIHYVYYKLIERLVVKYARGIVLVSNKFAAHLKVDACVLPMLVAENFLSSSNKSQIHANSSNEKIIFCYVGGLQSWQMIDESFKMYKSIEDRLTDTELWIITNENNSALEIAKRHGINNFRVSEVENHQLPAILDQCDYGFAIRNSSIVNRVSSPTKIMEYVARGVIPISSRYVGDYSEILTNEDFMLDADSLDVNLLCKRDQADRAKGILIAKKYRERYIAEYKKFIFGLAKI